MIQNYDRGAVPENRIEEPVFFTYGLQYFIAGVFQLY